MPPSLFDVESELFSALSHPARLQILELLSEGETCVCHIQAVLGQRQAYVSQQLMALRQAGLVESRKEGLRVYYRIDCPQLTGLLEQARRLVRAQSRGGRLAEVALTPPRGRCHCPRCASAPAA